MNKKLDDILKECLMQDLEIVGEKVYKKIAGLPNLGRTYFCKQSEVNEKKQFAQDQMVQKYGAEMYGLDAQLGNQSSTDTAASTGKSSDSVDRHDSLIQCKCTQFLKIPEEKANESSGGGYPQFENAFKEFKQWAENKSKTDDDWKSKHDGSLKNINDAYAKINGKMTVNDPENKKNLKSIFDLLKESPWKDDAKNDSNLKKLINDMKNGYNSWKINGGNVDGDGNSPTKVDTSDNSWNPNLTFKIDIHTSFDDQWFKRKFKSGMLNKILFTIKDDMRSHSQGGTKGEWTGHKYTADEMLPQDKRKLDSLQWKMTNKVAKDYVALLLGWSRPKEKYNDAQGMEPTQELQQDTGFGKSMAKKSLDNRGILGRLKQKLFSGQQSNNLISVVFQLSDPNDYKLIERPKKDDDIDTSIEDDDQNPQEQVNESTNSFDFTMKLDDDTMMKLLEESLNEPDDETMDLARSICEESNSEKVSKLVDNCVMKLV